MKHLQHDHVLKLYGIVTDLAPFRIVTEYCAGGTLEKKLRDPAGNPESRLLRWSHHAADGIGVGPLPLSLSLP